MGDEAGSVELKELLKLFPANGLSQAFAKYDTDKSGGIDKAELEAALKTLPKPKSVKMGKKVPLEELFAAMDEDGNGVIDLTEWEKNMPEGLKASIVEAVLAEAERKEPTPVRCKLTDMPAEVEKAVNAGLTPLIVDNSESGLVDTFVSYGKSPYPPAGGCQLFEAKKMALSKTIKRMEVPAILDEYRKHVVSALSEGRCLTIVCETCVPDFAKEFQGDDTVPTALFQRAGRALVEDASKFWRAEDKAQGLDAMERGGKFATVITTAFAPDAFQGFLFGNEWGLPKPFSMYQPIIIEHDAGVPLRS